MQTFEDFKNHETCINSYAKLREVIPTLPIMLMEVENFETRSTSGLNVAVVYEVYGLGTNSFIQNLGFDPHNLDCQASYYLEDELREDIKSMAMLKGRVEDYLDLPNVRRSKPHEGGHIILIAGSEEECLNFMNTKRINNSLYRALVQVPTVSGISGNRPYVSCNCLGDMNMSANNTNRHLTFTDKAVADQYLEWCKVNTTAPRLDFDYDDPYFDYDYDYDEVNN